MAASGVILCLALVAKGQLNEKINIVFSRITAINSAGLSILYIINGMAIIDLVSL